MSTRRPLTLAIVAASALVIVPARAQQGSERIQLTIGGAARAAAERTAAPAIGRERAIQADQRVRQRQADFLPHVTALGSEGERTFNSAALGISFSDPISGRPAFDPRGQVLGPIRAYDMRATLRQTVADPGARARVAVARSAADALDSDVEALAQHAAGIAAIAVVSAARADALLGARVADSALAADLVEIARAQLAAGTGIALDVTRAEAAAAAARAQIIAARNGVARTRMDLARAVGLSALAPVTPAESLDRMVSASDRVSAADTRTDLMAQVAIALERRADLRSAAAQLTVADRQVRAIRAERLPTLAGFADEGATGRATNHLLNTWTWGVQMTVPVFDGFRREARVAEQRSVVREVETRRRDLAAQVEADVRGAWLDLATAVEQMGAARERERLANQEVAQARDRFAAGVAGNADVITASQNLVAARTFLIDSESATLLARVLVARAQGVVTELP